MTVELCSLHLKFSSCSYKDRVEMHYVNMSMQYIVIFQGSKNEIF